MVRWAVPSILVTLSCGCGGRSVLGTEGSNGGSSGDAPAAAAPATNTGGAPTRGNGGGATAGAPLGRGGAPAAAGGDASDRPDQPPCGSDMSKDAANCGYCGHSCRGGACVGGVCEPVVLAYLGNDGASALAVDEDEVFWVSPVTALPKDGGLSREIASSRPSIWGVAVDGTNVFWTNLYGELMTAPKAGGAAVSLGKGGYRVAVDDQYAYTAWKGVWRVPKGGGTAQTLAEVGGQGIALDDDAVYFTTWGDGVPGVGGLFRVPKSGGEVVKLAAADCSSYVAVFADTVYWGNHCVPGGVRAVPKAGGDARLLKEANTPYGIAADAAGVYWTEFFSGTVWMLPTGGDTPILLASGQFYPRDLAVDETAVYFTNDASKSAIVRVAKP